MKTRAAVLVAMLAFAFAGAAQQNNPIDYTPVSCIPAGELPLLQMNVSEKGELRAYFRRINTSDWCSVMGVNDGPLSRIVLPKFDDGEEIEYFLVLIEGRRVVARSPRIFRARASTECGATSARHIARLSMSCGEETGGLPTSGAAGYALEQNLILGNPPYGSPDHPE